MQNKNVEGSAFTFTTVVAKLNKTKVGLCFQNVKCWFGMGIQRPAIARPTGICMLVQPVASVSGTWLF
jgi:hypothetical protein